MGAENQLLWDVLEEHLDEAGFLWERWERSLVSPLLRPRQVAEGDEARLLAHVEGLTIGGSAAADGLLEPALREGEAGEASAAALALLALPDGLARLRAALADGDPDQRETPTRARRGAPGPRARHPRSRGTAGGSAPDRRVERRAPPERPPRRRVHRRRAGR